MRQVVLKYRQRQVRAYIIAIAASFISLYLTVLIWPSPNNENAEASPFLLTSAATLCTAWYFGRGPGLVATFITTMGHAWYLYPPDSLLVSRSTDLIRLVVFAVTGVTFSYMSGARQRAEKSLKFLSTASMSLGSSLDFLTVMERGAGLAIPTLADFSALYITGTDGKVAHVITAHCDAAKMESARQFCSQLPDLKRDVALGGVLKSGFTDIQNSISDGDLESLSSSAEELRLRKELRMRSRLIVPLVARGNIIGAFAFMWRSNHVFRPSAVDLAEEFANRVALAIDNARMYMTSRQTTDPALSNLNYLN